MEAFLFFKKSNNSIEKSYSGYIIQLNEIVFLYSHIVNGD